MIRTLALLALLVLPAAFGIGTPGAYAQAPPDTDNDGLADVVDPCDSDARNLCVGEVAVDGTTGLPIRLNAHLSTAECSGAKTDCNGDVWAAEFGYNQAAKASLCNLGGGGEGCVVTGIVDIFGCEDESTEDLFQCEHSDNATQPELAYAFDVPDGRYVVNLFFANTFDNTAALGSRTFDIIINGEIVHDDFDQVAAAGGSGIAVVRSADISVANGDGLTIELIHGIENPAIKAIEVLRFGCSVAADCDDNNSCTSDLCSSGACVNTASAGACDDGLACTSDDTCAAGRCVGVDACSAGASCNPNTGSCGAIAIAFGKTTLAGVTLDHPTSLDLGPDGRLYVSQQDGLIYVFDVERSAANAYAVVGTETITSVREIPNHDDDGTLNPTYTDRQVTGILATGTASNPVLYVTSSDPRIGGNFAGTDKNLDTNSGVISRLTFDGTIWQHLDIVRGLPRSEENHSSNGLVLDEAAGILYLAQGGHTNMGAPSNNFALTTEYALSAAILAIDLDAIGDSTYDLPTLNDETRPGIDDAGDPFGGNDGLNQARLVPGGPVSVYSPGYRNAYDLVLTEDGRMFVTDNGSNTSWGGVPGAGCTNDIVELGTDEDDRLHYVDGAGYYGGHPNPTRGNAANTFNPSNPQSPVAGSNPVECDFLENGVNDTAIAIFPESTNGIADYTASNFGNALAGDLLAAGFQHNKIYRITLDPSGTDVESVTTLFSNVGAKPLDVTAQGNGEAFPGTVWVADWLTGAIVVYEPDDSTACSDALDCSDADPCTDDFCVTGNCAHSTNTAPCDDGIACTAADTCSAGACAGTDACAEGEVCDHVDGLCRFTLTPLIDATLEDFHVPGTQVGDISPEVIQTSDSCNGCHGPYDVANDPYSTWRGSVMAQGGRDPLFRAQLAQASQDVANAGYFCMRCHMPMTIVTGHANDTDASTLDATDLDGINCHFCHSMVDPIYKPGTSPIEDLTVLAAHDDVPTTYGNAMFVLDPTGLRRGPYDDAEANHDWIASPFHRTSEQCGTCHDIGNLAVSRQPDGTYRYNGFDLRDPSGDPLQMFPLQRTYSEWKLSAFAAGGVDMGGRFGGTNGGVVETCQDCHMPRVVAAGCVFTDERPDLARHEFAGAGAPVLDLIAELYKDDPAVDLPSIARGRAAAVTMLQSAATIELSQTDPGHLDVRVTNETGHKLPTGHSEGRRMWINVRFFDADGALVGEHGHYDTTEATLDRSSTVVFEMLMGLSADAAAVTGKQPGVTGHMALADTIEKDNRIPPRGFTNAAFEAAGAPVVGEDYEDGQYWHDSRFELPSGAVRADVALYYQSTPREYVEELRDSNYSNHWGDTLHDVWEKTGRGTPIAMASASRALTSPCVGVSLPPSIRCATGRECTIPISISTAVFDVGDVNATLTSNLPHDCTSASEVGAAAANGSVSVAPDTCETDIAELAGNTDGFNDGELARVRWLCDAPGTDTICVDATASESGATDALPTCGAVCVPIECGECLPGDCDQNGTVDTADAACTALCAVGRQPAGADCSCAADCNCSAGTEAADAICTELRPNTGLENDPCISAAPAESVVAPELRAGKLRSLPSGKRKYSILRLRGSTAATVAAARAAIWTDGSLVKLRLSPRLADAGFRMVRAMSGDDRGVFLVLPPAGNVAPIGRGRIGRAVVTPSATKVTLSAIELGSVAGLPIDLGN
jgi:hypothetical protein